jgi:cobalt/nickel transport system permease protein
MHISEGVLNPEILIIGNSLAAVVLFFAFKNLNHEKITLVAVLAALFFIASFIHIPIGPTSVHLIMSGVLGVFLGFDIFVAVFVGLFLQALLFGYGGISVLGVNLLLVATPGLLSYLILKIKIKNQMQEIIGYFLAGSLPIVVSALFLSFLLALNGEEFYAVASLSFFSNIPIMIIEGLFVILIFKFIKKVSPKILEKRA